MSQIVYEFVLLEIDLFPKMIQFAVGYTENECSINNRTTITELKIT